MSNYLDKDFDDDTDDFFEFRYRKDEYLGCYSANAKKRKRKAFVNLLELMKLGMKD